jgi:hypothetical protein
MTNRYKYFLAEDQDKIHDNRRSNRLYLANKNISPKRKQFSQARNT